jgi:hypothetical protein
MGGAIHMVIDRQYHLEHPDRPLARTTDGARARSTRTLRHAVWFAHQQCVIRMPQRNLINN